MSFLWPVENRPAEFVSETYYTVSGLDERGKVTGIDVVNDRSFGMGCIERDEVPSRKVFERAVLLALHQVVDHCIYPYGVNMPPFTTRDLVAFGPTERGFNYLRDFRLVETVMHGLGRRIVLVKRVESGFIRNPGELARLGVGTEGHVALWADDLLFRKPQELLKVS